MTSCYSNLNFVPSGLNFAELNWQTSSLLDLIHPIGSIYVSMNSTSPEILFGGTWKQLYDRFLYLTNSALQTGGEATHILTIDEMPSHNHSVYFKGYHNIAGGTTWKCLADIEYPDDHPTNMTCENKGSDQPHNNMPPYITCYGWVRIA